MQRWLLIHCCTSHCSQISEVGQVTSWITGTCWCATLGIHNFGKIVYWTGTSIKKSQPDDAQCNPYSAFMETLYIKNISTVSVMTNLTVILPSEPGSCTGVESSVLLRWLHQHQEIVLQLSLRWDPPPHHQVLDLHVKPSLFLSYLMHVLYMSYCLL